MKGLAQRGGTAVVFVAVMLAGLYGGKFAFIALFTLVTALCLWEYFGLTMPKETAKDTSRKIIGLVLGMIPFALASATQLGYLTWTNQSILLAVLLYFSAIFLVFIFELFANSKLPYTNLGLLFLGIIYIGIPFAALDIIAIHEGQYFPNTVLGLLLLTWANDTGAYLLGSQIGKTPLFPRISPKKTWEGTLSGVFVTFLVAWLLSYLFKEQSLLQWEVLALIVVIFGSIGDLVESMLKRSLNIKDSGTFLPGHGGFLDRFDAFIFLIPFAAAYLTWIR